MLSPDRTADTIGGFIRSKLSARIHLMPRPASQDLGFAPGDRFGEVFAVDECLEGCLGFPLAEDDVAAFGLDVFVVVASHCAGRCFQRVEPAEESFFKFFFLAGNQVVLHAVGCLFLSVAVGGLRVGGGIFFKKTACNLKKTAATITDLLP